jgi:hypothetical protein
MTKRVISFEIDDEIAGHFDALSADWKKDPVWLARAFFTEEVMANISGSRGVPHSRRYWYRDMSVYFTTQELDEREAEIERNRDPVEEARRLEDMREMFAKAERNRRKKA